MILANVYGATIKTTIADLSFLAALGGMHASLEPGIIACTPCREMLTLSHHPVVGRIAYYRSSRENINGGIIVPAPNNMGLSRFSLSSCRLSSVPMPKTHPPSLHV